MVVFSINQYDMKSSRANSVVYFVDDNPLKDVNFAGTGGVFKCQRISLEGLEGKGGRLWIGAK